MRIVQSYTSLPEECRGASAAIGNFDGVHLGHQSVLDIARRQAASSGAPLGVVTFEPHPRQYFAPDSPPFRLMNPESRANRFAKLGVDILYELPFDARLAGLDATAFATEVLAEGLGLTHAVVGQDFRFGKGRTGDAAGLIALGESLGFGVTAAPLLLGPEGEVSSTAIRTALSEGRPGDAATMLGHWHRIEGEVLHGEARGRELGYPTANMSIDNLHAPRFGVYAVKATVLTGPHAGEYDGAASLGVRPQFGENRANLETFIFDFSGDLYGAHISIALVEFLRPEARFDGLDALIDQMGRDCARAREILDRLRPVGDAVRT